MFHLCTVTCISNLYCLFVFSCICTPDNTGPHGVNNILLLFAVDPAWNPCKEIYWDDVNLNKVGKEKLSNSLFSGLATVYFSVRLRREILVNAP